jgi:hypothetical protein
MGLFDSIFGKKPSAEKSEGLWLSGERSSSWRAVAKFSETQSIEISPESCYSNNLGTFCVVRSYNKEKNLMIYMGCLIPNGQSDFLLIAVDRHETPVGDVIKFDDWTKNRILSKEKIPTLSNLIMTAKAGADFNNYSTLPPFVFWLTLKLGK